MKDPHLAKQKHTHPRALPLADLGAKRRKQRLDIGPADRAADRPGEHRLQRGSVTLSHGR